MDFIVIFKFIILINKCNGRKSTLRILVMKSYYIESMFLMIVKKIDILYKSLLMSLSLMKIINRLLRLKDNLRNIFSVYIKIKIMFSMILIIIK